MELLDVKNWITGNPALAIAIAALLFVAILLLARLIFGRGLVYLTTRTKKQ